MKLRQYMNEAGDDLAGLDKRVVKRIVSDKLKRAKNKKDLDRIFNGFVSHTKRWGKINTEIVDMIKMMFDDKKKELGI